VTEETEVYWAGYAAAVVDGQSKPNPYEEGTPEHEQWFWGSLLGMDDWFYAQYV